MKKSSTLLVLLFVALSLVANAFGQNYRAQKELLKKYESGQELTKLEKLQLEEVIPYVQKPIINILNNPHKPGETKADLLTEDFSGGSLPTGWTNVDASGTNVWEFNNPGGRTINTTTNANGFAILDSDHYGGGPEDSRLTTSAINCSANTTVILEFEHYFRQYNSSSAEVLVSGDNGATWTTIETWSTSTANAEAESYNISTTAAGQSQVLIQWHWTGDYEWYWAVDDIRVYEPSATPEYNISPASKDFGTVNLSETSSNQTFTISNTGGGTLTVSSATIVGTNSGDFTISDAPTFPQNLTNGQSFTLNVSFSPSAEGARSANLRVTADAKVDHDTPLSGTGHNTTLTPPITQDFATYPPTDWTEGTGLLAAPSTITGTSSTWQADGFANSGTTGAARINIYGTSAKEWLFTPPIQLGDGTTDYQLEFDVAFTDYANSNPPESVGDDDKFAVVISTDGGTTWTSANALQQWTNSSTPTLASISNTGTHVTISLASYSGLVKIGFYGESTTTNADNDLSIDNFEIREIPTSPVFDISPASKDFGDIGTGQQSTAQTFTISNTGVGSLTIDPAPSLVGTNASEFSISDANVYPKTLTGGQSCTLNVTFSPNSTGSKSATLRVVDNLSKTTHDIPLTGNGVNYNSGGDGTSYGGYYWSNSTPQSGNNNPPTYEWIDPVQNGHTQVSAVTSGSFDDGYYTTPIGFEFTFFGNPYTDVHIGTNGYLTFGSGTTSTAGSLTIPSSTAPNNLIAVATMDLNNGTNGKIYYGNTGGNFVATWWHYIDYGDEAEYITCQAILKPNGNIKLQYNYNESALNAATSSSTINGDALIGIENSDGTVGISYRVDGTRGPIFTSSKAGSMALEFGKTESGLPVEITLFNVNVDGQKAILNWQTATEVNNYGFEIQRNVNDDENNWEKVGFVEGSGNSNSPKNYSFVDQNLAIGRYLYRLKQIDIDGNYKYSDVVEANIEKPAKFALEQNYPNPFNPSTEIRYSLAKSTFVELNVYNSIGQEIARLVNSKQEPGNYKVSFNSKGLPSGVYFYHLRTKEFNSFKKMILLK